MSRALLINPWIYDFSAFDLWACPLGLLNIASLLRENSFDVDFYDFTDRWHPSGLGSKGQDHGFHIGNYASEEVPKPDSISWVPRKFKRYGLPPEVVERDLTSLERPDVILMTSRMTYWYLGVREAIKTCRLVFPGVPIVLGGIYASFCPEHAKSLCQPDLVFIGEAENRLPEVFSATGLRFSYSHEACALDLTHPGNLPFPAYDLLRNRSAIAIETTRGCPYRCTYCSSGNRYPKFKRKPVNKVLDELERCITEFGTTDFAFYDDALLISPEEHFLPISQKICERGLKARFHAPNSLFANAINHDVAHAMKAMGFETVRISLESADVERLRAWNRRHVLPEHFVEAMLHLREAGFSREQIGVYILCAMPGQTDEEVRLAIDFVISEGGTPRLAEYSPIPGTAEWPKAVQQSGLPLESEPLLHNNSLYYWASGAIEPHRLADLKNYAKRYLEQNTGAKNVANGRSS
jgi:radical SAM superfamily enzyme YgiQ (UPF0313 family)